MIKNSWWGKCLICGQPIWIIKYNFDRGLDKYCSRDCYHKSRFGKKVSLEGRKHISMGKIAEKNPMWKGDLVGKKSLHEWIINRFPKPKLCVCCNKREPIDLANKSQKYKRDLSDWEWLCRRCHMDKDGRIHNLKYQ